MPFGVVISQANAGSQLETRLVYALTRLFEGGANSTMLRLANEWLDGNGVSPSDELAKTGFAISYLGVAPDEDAVWFVEERISMLT